MCACTQNNNLQCAALDTVYKQLHFYAEYFTIVCTDFECFQCRPSITFLWWLWILFSLLMPKCGHSAVHTQCVYSLTCGNLSTHLYVLNTQTWTRKYIIDLTSVIILRRMEYIHHKIPLVLSDTDTCAVLCLSV